MLLLTAFIECAPAHRTELIDAASVCARTSREEEGCLDYRFYEDIEQPARFAFIERWRDRAALDAHLASSHLAEFRAVRAPLVTRRKTVVYDVDGGTEY